MLLFLDSACSTASNSAYTILMNSPPPIEDTITDTSSSPTMQYDFDALIESTPETTEDICAFMSALFVSDGAYTEGILSALIRAFMDNPLLVVESLVAFAPFEQTFITQHITLYLTAAADVSEAMLFSKTASALLEESEESERQIYSDLLTNWIAVIEETASE
jgi:hypothetical protein